MHDDIPATWEFMLTNDELRIASAEDDIADDYRPEELCCNCRLPKTLRSSGRCFACEKSFQRHGVERPRKDIDREILRRWG
jgi:hypothetical protein